MIWKNGLTWEEEKRRKKTWHRWFAWYPIVYMVRDGHKYKVWLQTIERRGEFWSSWAEEGWDYEYRLLEEEK